MPKGQGQPGPKPPPGQRPLSPTQLAEAQATKLATLHPWATPEQVSGFVERQGSLRPTPAPETTNVYGLGQPVELTYRTADQWRADIEETNRNWLTVLTAPFRGLSEGVERAWGFARQLFAPGQAEDVLGHPREAWLAGEFNYASEMYRTRAGLPVGLSLLHRARTMLAAGMSLTDVQAEIRSRYPDFQTEAGETFQAIGQTILDPLWAVGPFIPGPIAAIQRIGSRARWIAPAGEAAQLADRAVDAMRVAEAAGGSVDEVAELARVALTATERAAEEGGRALRWYERVAVTLTGGLPMSPEDALRWAASGKVGILESVRALLRGDFRTAARWGGLPHMLFRLTPESAAHEIIENLDRWVQVSTANARTAPALRASLQRAASFLAGGRLGPAGRSPGARAMSAWLQKIMPEIDNLLNFFESPMAREQMSDIAALARLTGHSTDEFMGMIWRGKTDELLQAIRTAIASPPEGMQGLARTLLERLPDLNASTLQGFGDVFKNLPYNEALLRTTIRAQVASSSARIAEQVLGVRRAGFWVRQARSLKAVETLLYLRLNPGYFVRNLWNNEGTMLAHGLWNMMRPAEIAKIWERAGVLDPRAYSGIGAADLPVSNARSAADAMRGALEDAEEFIGDAVRGDPTWVERLVNKVQNMLPTDAGRWASAAESWASSRALTAAFLDAYPYYARMGVGYSQMPVGLRQMIGEEQYRAIELALPHAMNSAERRAIFYSDNLNLSLGMVVDDVTRRTGRDAQAVRDVFGPELMGNFERDLTAAMKTGDQAQVSAVIDDYVRRAEARIDEGMRGVNFRQYAEETIQADGPTGVARVYGQSETYADSAMEAHLRNLDDDIARLRLLPTREARRAAWQSVSRRNNRFWNQIRSTIDDQMRGLVAGARRMELDASTIETVARQRAGAFREFYDAKNSLMEAFFRGDWETPVAREQAWVNLNDQLDTLYGRLMDAEQTAASRIDNEIGRLIPDPNLRGIHDEARALVRRIRQDYMVDMRAAYRRAVHMDEATRARFFADTVVPRRVQYNMDVVQANRNWMAALRGNAPPAAPSRIVGELDNLVRSGIRIENPLGKGNVLGILEREGSFDLRVVENLTVPEGAAPREFGLFRIDLSPAAEGTPIRLEISHLALRQPDDVFRNGLLDEMAHVVLEPGPPTGRGLGYGDEISRQLAAGQQAVAAGIDTGQRGARLQEINDVAAKALWPEGRPRVTGLDRATQQDQINAWLRENRADLWQEAEGIRAAENAIGPAAPAAPTAAAPAPVTRAWRAGNRQAEITFVSEEQQVVYDAGAKLAQTMRGQNPLPIETANAAVRNVAERLGISEDEASDLARNVYRDVREQMSGVADGEARTVVDNIGIEFLPAPTAAAPATGAAPTAAAPAPGEIAARYNIRVERVGGSGGEALGRDAMRLGTDTTPTRPFANFGMEDDVVGAREVPNSVITEAHETAHVLYSRNPEAGQRAISAFGQLNREGFTADMLSDAGMMYLLDPDALRAADPEVFGVIDNWMNEIGPAPTAAAPAAQAAAPAGDAVELAHNLRFQNGWTAYWINPEGLRASDPELFAIIDGIASGEPTLSVVRRIATEDLARGTLPVSGRQATFLPDIRQVVPDNMPIGPALRELWDSDGARTLEHMRVSATDLMGRPPLRIRGLTPDAEAGLRTFATRVEDESGGVMLASLNNANMRRDMSLLNYNRRTDFDTYAGMVFPFSFWTTHSMMNWFLWSVDHPAWAATMIALRDAAQNSQEVPGMPRRLRGMMPTIRLPFAPEWMGRMFVNPLGVSLPMDQWIRTGENVAYELGDEQDRVMRRLDVMLENGEIDQDSYNEATQTQSGPTWDFARRSVSSGEDNWLDAFSMLSSPHAPLMWAYNAARGRPFQPGPFLPATRTIRGMAGMFGADVNIEAPLRRALGLPEFDQYDTYRINRQLANMAVEGYPTEELLRARVEQSGPLWDEASRRAVQQYSVTANMGLLGVPAQLYPPGEEESRELVAQFGEAVEAEDAGDEGAIGHFLEEHPEVGLRLGLNDSPEEQAQRFLVDLVWNGYNGLTDYNQQEAVDQFGPLFEQTFLNRETRDHTAVPPEILAMWARSLGEDPPGQFLPGPGTAFALELTPPEISQRIQVYYDSRRRAFDWQEVRQLQDDYFMLDEGAARRQFRQDHPVLPGYWSWRRQFLYRNPDLIPYLVEDPESYTYPSEEALRAAQAGQPNFTWAEWTTTLGPNLSALVEDYAYGEDLPASAREQLGVIAQNMGLSQEDILNRLTTALAQQQ